ncbi:MAG: hypothetical protein KAZ26_20010 [Caldilineaceae bacterium]|nr:hypothetical protein [Caldilineaceae bacterium]
MTDAKKAFTFTEQETKQLAELLTDCRGVAYYDNLVADFFSQLENGLDVRKHPPITDGHSKTKGCTTK